ncbi:MAG: pyridoxamine 5'-phosphate oxidase [Bacteroidota bacterium]|nr:pyridoxamine 5'-phosphate oxidase [Bacteroidota bacterium]MDP4211800.1 pyridoxamine 5'-phosphate oxidase [Bacteroidota bacterium]MDP4251064.1 pyridoxamine 5'-phosphate oxidase [Bacteroidota bacterium]
MIKIADIRKEYRLKKLNRENAQDDAMQQFDLWWKEALGSEIVEVNAMTLATASADGLPAARIVLLKGYHAKGFQFYTNYNSFKGQQLQENPRACLVFFWKELERQVRITGVVEKLSEKDSDAYYQSRPAGSRVGAWASPQSEVIESSRWLEERAAELEKKYAQTEIPRPPHWGGYLVKPVTIEFWQGRPNRLHDRLLYTLRDDGKWLIEKLAP